MNSPQYNQHENHYAAVDGVTVYLDYINNRLKILDYREISDHTVSKIIVFAEREEFGKIISNCRIRLIMPFKNNGFRIEGIINGFFKGEDAYCVSYFPDKNREVALRKEEEDIIIDQCMSSFKKGSVSEGSKYTIRKAVLSDIPDMVKLFSNVFESYPSPVFSMEYLKKIMNDCVLFKVADEDGRIISIASADMDIQNLNAEITDCATYCEYRGRGILTKLIQSLEVDLKKKGFQTSYSLSRAVNPGINKALSRLEYKYCGRLVNNCHICGDYEDMNIWVKNLAR